MNAKERVMNRLKGKPVDRAPNACLTMAMGPKYINKSFSDFYLDYRVLVEANLKLCHDFELDILGTISDPYREAYDFGAKIEFPQDSIPICKEYLIQSPEDMKKLKVFDPYSSTRILDRIKAIELFKKEAGNEYPIMGWVECPLAEAADLRGVNSIMLDFFDNTSMLEELLEICLETEIRCAKAQITAGADIIGMGDAVASLIGPELYRTYAFEHEKKLVQAVHEAGAVARLHICGNITSILDDMKLTGADIIDIDWMVDFKTASEKLKGYSSPCGNFDPVQIMKQGTPETVKEAVWQCLDADNETSFIMGGCEIPIGTPPENFKAVTKALKAYGCK